MIRIVGLSATLPNYVDVAQFLRVNPMVGTPCHVKGPKPTFADSFEPSQPLRAPHQVGLFFFDNGFRPVPLQQCFIGVKVKGALRTAQVMNELCYDKVVERYEASWRRLFSLPTPAWVVERRPTALFWCRCGNSLRAGHQVMIFVHSRKDTVRTGQILRELSSKKGHTELFAATQNARYATATSEINKSRNRELRVRSPLRPPTETLPAWRADHHAPMHRLPVIQELFSVGLGCHNAGMLRSDRNLVERVRPTARSPTR